MEEHACQPETGSYISSPGGGSRSMVGVVMTGKLTLSVFEPLQKYEDAVRSDRERYFKEYKSLYGEDAPAVQKEKAKAKAKA